MTLASKVLLGGLALAALAWTPAGAQEADRSIFAGETLRGVLAETDRKSGDNTYYDVFRLTAEPGKTYVALLESEEFDPYLIVTGPGGYNESDDDDGPGVASRLEFSSERGGVFELRANSLSPSTGRYSISIAEVAATAGAGRELAVGDSVTGALANDSPRYNKGAGYQSYVFNGEAGARISIEMTSDDFDTFLYLRRNGSAEELAEDDDSAGELNSLINLTLPETGEYEIIATAVSPGDTGDFTLSLREGPKRVEPESRPLAYGEIRFSEIDGDDGLDEKDLTYELYEFTGRRGDRVVIHMSSDDFDPMLFLRREDGEILADDDDSGDGPLDAKIQYVLPADGRYAIHATAFEQGSGGAYMLGLGVETRR